MGETTAYKYLPRLLTEIIPLSFLMKLYKVTWCFLTLKRNTARMKHTSFKNMNCALAQSLEIVGERWSLLIIRDAAFGIRRFDDIQKNLGIARNILAQRLGKLANEGILEKTRGKRGRMEYRLTEKGWDLQPALLALFQWGEKYQPHPDGERMHFIDGASGNTIQPMTVRACDGQRLKPRDVWAKRGPSLSKEITS